MYCESPGPEGLSLNRRGTDRVHSLDDGKPHDAYNRADGGKASSARQEDEAFFKAEEAWPYRHRD